MHDILGTIGNTPLVKLDRIAKDNGTIFVKLEYFSPGHSKKDRIAKQIIEDAEAEGRLKTGQDVVALTSGNTGIGLTIVCRSKGYHFIAVMSKGNSIERARMMEALGAEVVLVDQVANSHPGQVTGADLMEVELKVNELAKERKALAIDQFEERGNFRAHFLGTGPEIWQQSHGNLDGFCDFVGTGGSFAGCAASLKIRNAKIRCYAVEPIGGTALAKQESAMIGHPIQGGGYGIANLQLFDRSNVDGFVSVSGSDAKHYAQLLAKEEGIYAGYSTGANLAAAIELLKGPLKGGSIAILACDSGLKYASTDLWQ